MKKCILILLTLLLYADSFSQVSLRGSMGIQFQSTPSLTDYLNLFPEQVSDFTSAVIFSVEGGYPVSPNSELGLEVAYLLTSFESGFSAGVYDLSYGIIMPSLIWSYVIRGSGYNFKFGGGGGVRLVNLEEKFPSQTPQDYSSTGVGFLLRGEGNTSLGGRFYANIGAELRYDINGEPENNGTPIRNEIFKENLNLNSFSVGLRLGLSYQF